MAPGRVVYPKITSYSALCHEVLGVERKGDEHICKLRSFRGVSESKEPGPGFLVHISRPYIFSVGC